MLFKTDEESKIKDSEADQSKSMGWYLKYRKSQIKISKPSDCSHREYSESENDAKFNFSRGESNILQGYRSRHDSE